jgi:uncharacterized membrane protein YeaQ/YmgE (transglycosylase-associated protein family)
MAMEGVIVFLLVGLAAGFLAGKLLGTDSGGILASLIIGVIGAVIGGFLFHRLGIAIHGIAPLLTELLAAVVGSVILLILLRFIRK